MTEHSLKTWPHEHDAIGDGSKPFEVRSNTDRSFGVGDILLLRRWYPGVKFGCYLNMDGVPVSFADQAHTHRRRVTYILHGGRFGFPPGTCVMGLEPARLLDEANRQEEAQRNE